MSTENERDTHFANFASNLVKELDEKDLIPDSHAKLIIKERMAIIIARRAYDLVLHTADCIDAAWLVRLDLEEIPPRIPDMTSFPN